MKDVSKKKVSFHRVVRIIFIELLTVFIIGSFLLSISYIFKNERPTSVASLSECESSVLNAVDPSFTMDVVTPSFTILAPYDSNTPDSDFIFNVHFFIGLNGVFDISSNLIPSLSVFGHRTNLLDSSSVSFVLNQTTGVEYQVGELIPIAPIPSTSPLDSFTDLLFVYGTGEEALHVYVRHSTFSITNRSAFLYSYRRSIVDMSSLGYEYGISYSFSLRSGDTISDFFQIVVPSYAYNLSNYPTSTFYSPEAIQYLTSLAENANESYFNSGYSQGYENGVVSGSSSGYLDGYSDGDSAGYDRGFIKGVSSANDYSFSGLFSSMFDSLTSTFYSLFDFEIFGYDIRSFLLSMLAVLLLVTLLRVFVK